MTFRNPRNLLILLGFVCQGYSWEVSLVPLIFIGLWGLSIYIGSQKTVIPQWLEALALLVSFVGFKLISDLLGFGYTNLMFLGGNVLLVYQIIHLLGPSDLREKRISILIAIMHIGVGTQFIFDYKAFTILLASFFLIPRTLYIMDSEYYSEDTATKYSRRNIVERIVLACLMILFFMLFPRFSLQTGGANQLLSSSSRGGPLSQEVDMTRSVGQGSEQLIFQIEGKDIGYLKCFALDKFDGAKWSASRWLKKMDRKFASHDIDSSLYRSVRVFNFKVLRNSLPIDDFVQNLKVDYPDPPYIAGDGSVKVGFNLRKNLSYVYWTKKSLFTKRLGKKEKKRYLKVPPQSPQLNEWLNNFISDDHGPEKQVQKLVNFFRSEFKYKIGAPNLKRINPLDDFIFNQREGHCERFASALAVLLRLKGIPSRVVVGFLPIENNELGDFFNIRVRHAHAWVEAYFSRKGWQIIDATPYGRSVSLERRPLAFTFFEWIEYVWYSKIVEFGVNEQQALLNFASDKFKGVIALIFNFLQFILGFIGVIIGCFIIYNLDWRGWLFRKKKKVDSGAKRSKEASHFYARMIHALRKENYSRKSNQTPMEFLNFVERKDHLLFEEISFVTHCFCEIYYGQIELHPERKKQLKYALNKILKSKHR